MILYDSCFWIALLHPKDSCHNQAVQHFQTHISENIILPSCIYEEVLTVLKLKVGIEACTIFHNLLNEYEIEPEFIHEEYYTETIKTVLSDKKLSFVDSFLLVFSKNTRIEVLTFDKNLQKQL